MMYFVSRIKFESPLSGGICLLAVAALIALGFWQLDRSVQKKASIELMKARQQQAPVGLDGPSRSFGNLLYRRVRVSGEYDFRHQLLLDNRVVNGRIGVYVLTPLKMEGTRQAVLVNRGWVPMTNRRGIDGDLRIRQPRVTLNGMISEFPGVGFRIQGAEVPSGGWPGLIQLVDPEYLAGVLGYPLLPFQILLDPGDQPGFLREWEITYPVRPEKHVAYAVQWFALAALLVGLLAWNRNRGHA